MAKPALSKPPRLSHIHPSKLSSSSKWVFTLHHTLHDSLATKKHSMAAVYASLSQSIPSHSWLSVSDLEFNDTQVLAYPPPVGGLINITEAWPEFWHVQSRVEELLAVSSHPYCSAELAAEFGNVNASALRGVVRDACRAYWCAGLAPLVTTAPGMASAVVEGARSERSAYPLPVSTLLGLRKAGKKCMFVGCGQTDPAMEWWIRTDHSLWFFELGMFVDTEEGVGKADGLVEMLLRRIDAQDQDVGERTEEGQWDDFGEAEEGLWEDVVVVGDDWELDVLPALQIGVGLVIFVSPSEVCPEVEQQLMDRVRWVRSPVEVNAVLRYRGVP